MNLRKWQSEFVLDLSKLITFTYQSGLEMTAGELLRTQYQQAEYVRTGYSKTMDSRHLIKLAGDFNFFKDGRLLLSDKSRRIEDMKILLPIGLYWESLRPENVWGGDFNRNKDPFDEKFPDPYHFERIPK